MELIKKGKIDATFDEKKDKKPCRKVLLWEYGSASGSRAQKSHRSLGERRQKRCVDETFPEGYKTRARIKGSERQWEGGTKEVVLDAKTRPAGRS